MDDAVDFDKLVGSNIQRYRAAKGMSQSDLAEQLSAWSGEHVHQQTIQKIEKGTRALRYTEAVPLCALLDVELQDLAVGEPEAKLAAAAMRDRQKIEEMQQELIEFADRLAPMLVDQAMSAMRLRDSTLSEDTLKLLEASSTHALGINWGRDLNNALLTALRKDPYLAEIRPEIAAPTYTEILRRLADAPFIRPRSDDSET